MEAVNSDGSRFVVEVMNRLVSIVGAAALVATLASCSSSSKGASSPGASAPVVASAAGTGAATNSVSAPGASGITTAGIIISGFAYSGTLTVKAGAKVTVTNKDTAAHTLTDKVNKKFDTGNIAGNGGTGTFTAPSTPGTYKFGCTYHPNMSGTLIVTS